MSIGGVGSNGRPHIPENPSGPTGEVKPFGLPTTWQNKLEEVMDHLNPDHPQDVTKALSLLKELSQDNNVPPQVKNVAKEAITQIQEGYMQSNNPIELINPYLNLAHVSMPLGPGELPS